MHANVRNNEIIDFNCFYLDKDIIRIETTEKMYELYKMDNTSVIYKDGNIIKNPNYEQEQKEKEQERINNLELSQEEFWNYMLPITKQDAIDKIKQIPILNDKILIQLDNNIYKRNSLIIECISGIYNISEEELNTLFDKDLV